MFDNSVNSHRLRMHDLEYHSAHAQIRWRKVSDFASLRFARHRWSQHPHTCYDTESNIVFFTKAREAKNACKRRTWTGKVSYTAPHVYGVCVSFFIIPYQKRGMILAVNFQMLFILERNPLSFSNSDVFVCYKVGNPYCEQYSHSYWICYFIRRFSLAASHHQEYKHNKTGRKKK